MYACPLGSVPRLPAGLPSMGIGQRWRGGGRGGDAISNVDDNKRGGERRGQREIGHPIYVLLSPFGPTKRSLASRLTSRAK